MLRHSRCVTFFVNQQVEDNYFQRFAHTCFYRAFQFRVSTELLMRISDQKF